MCQIQFIKRYKENLGLEEVSKFMEMMNQGNVGNSDAWGLFNSVYSCKASGEFRQRLIDYKKLFNSNFIVGHNRFATSGKFIYKRVRVPVSEAYQSVPGSTETGQEEPLWTTFANYYTGVGSPFLTSNFGFSPLGWIVMYAAGLIKDKSSRAFGVRTKKGKASKSSKKNDQKDELKDYAIRYKRQMLPSNSHPFRIGNLLMVHNGIIYNHDYLVKQYNIKDAEKISTDSYVFLWLINYFMNESQAATREQRLAEGIRKAEIEIQGSYSIFLYDLSTQGLYYFKNWQTDFNFYQINDSLLIGSTVKYILDETFFEDINENNLELSKDSKRRIKICEVKIKNRVLYAISDNPEKPLRGVCKLNEDSFFKFNWHDADEIPEVSENVVTDKLKERYIKADMLNKTVKKDKKYNSNLKDSNKRGKR